MKKVLAMLAVVAMFGSFSWADCGACGSDQKSACSAACCQDALANFPKMIYRISDHDTPCAASAAKLAEDHEGETIKFVVAEKVYEEQAEAMNALADVAEEFVADFASPHTCEVSGTTSIGGAKTECNVMAAKMEEAIKEAFATVSMSYKVGDESCSCPMKAAALAEESGTKQLFVVAGEDTCCPVDARIKMAAAKYKAALEAIASLEAVGAEAETTES